MTALNALHEVMLVLGAGQTVDALQETVLAIQQIQITTLHQLNATIMV